MGSFTVMYIACALTVVVQLYVGNGGLSLVLGKPIKVYMAATGMEAEMLIERLSSRGISAYKQSIDGGVMDVFFGNSNKGDYIFVAEKQADRAKQIIEEYKLL